MDERRDGSQITGTSNEAKNISVRRNMILFWDAGACSGTWRTFQIVAVLERDGNEWVADSLEYKSQGSTLCVDE